MAGKLKKENHLWVIELDPGIKNKNLVEKIISTTNWANGIGFPKIALL